MGQIFRDSDRQQRASIPFICIIGSGFLSSLFKYVIFVFPKSAQETVELMSIRLVDIIRAVQITFVLSSDFSQKLKK